MKNKSKLITIIVILAITPLLTFSASILAPGDFIIAINTNNIVSYSRIPDPANASRAIDGTSANKYLNFGGGGWNAQYTGFIVTPTNGSLVWGQSRLFSLNLLILG